MFNQNYVYPFLNNYANSNTNMNFINQQDLYRNSTMPSLFTPAQGLDYGNMFSNLYQPYKNYKPANVPANNERESLIRELARMGFAAHELNLYLDLHPEDTTMITLFNDYREKYNQLVKQYDEKFGPLLISSNTLNQTPFLWERDIWPWEVKPNV